MPVTVVDRLEVIEVEQGKPESSAATPCSGELTVELRHEVAAIVRAGEVVAVSEITHDGVHAT